MPRCAPAAIGTVGQLKIEEALKRLEELVRAGGPELEPAVHAASQLGARGTKLMGKLMDDATPTLRFAHCRLCSRAPARATHWWSPAPRPVRRRP